MSEPDIVETSCCQTAGAAPSDKGIVTALGIRSLSTSQKPQDAAALPAEWAQTGCWDVAFQLPNAPIHTHVLPNGKVLFWGRRDSPEATMDEHECTPWVWDPKTRESTPTPKPKTTDPGGAT